MPRQSIEDKIRARYSDRDLFAAAGMLEWYQAGFRYLPLAQAWKAAGFTDPTIAFAWRIRLTADEVWWTPDEAYWLHIHGITPDQAAQAGYDGLADLLMQFGDWDGRGWDPFHMACDACGCFPCHCKDNADAEAAAEAAYRPSDEPDVSFRSDFTPSYDF